MRQILFLVLVAVLSLPVPVSGPAAQSPRGLAQFAKGEVKIETSGGAHSFRVEIARTDRQQMQGLMFRRHMAADAGMLFVYRREAPIAMWMKNTFIPLDMIFIGRGGRIVKIVQRTVPLSEATISSGSPVVAVLELNAGSASRLGIRTGDRVLSSALGGRP